MIEKLPDNYNQMLGKYFKNGIELSGENGKRSHLQGLICEMHNS